jgi:hypothetical protein
MIGIIRKLRHQSPWMMTITLQIVTMKRTWSPQMMKMKDYQVMQRKIMIQIIGAPPSTESSPDVPKTVES